MKYWNQSSAEDEIRRLKSDLFLARVAIIQLMPYETGQLLRGYYSCASRIEGHKWMEGVVDSLVAQAEGSARPPNKYGEKRSMCPLCGRGSSSPYVEGYSLPEGLRRHLIGWGNTGRCMVMETVSNLARDYWSEEFAAAEQEARIAARAIDEKRRKTETLYRVSPDQEPKLLDEESYSWSPARAPGQLAWAEERLKSLGFHCLIERKIQSWVDERVDCVVYADVRQAGKLEFRVWRKPLPKRMSSNSWHRCMAGSFYLLDSWKNGLPEKYTRRVTQSLALRPPQT